MMQGEFYKILKNGAAGHLDKFFRWDAENC